MIKIAWEQFLKIQIDQYDHERNYKCPKSTYIEDLVNGFNYILYLTWNF